jgi:hypothetical protein
MLEDISLTKIAAWWGASASTVALLWHILKWKAQGTRLTMWLEPAAKSPGIAVENSAGSVAVTVSNIGGRPTTLHRLGYKYYAGLSQRLIGKPAKTATLSNPSANYPLPRVIRPEDHWVASLPLDDVDQDPPLGELARTGHLVIYAIYSNTRKEVSRRLVIPDGKP